ncbi:MAG: BA14K family protein [Mesorhizobium sp.]|nr:BA14K family protein [Mesorhizobium sp.]
MDQHSTPTGGSNAWNARTFLAASCVLLLTTLAGAIPAAADNYVVIPSPAINGAVPPYGPGFDTGVVIRPQDGCRSVVNCAPGDYRNRPAHRRYYDNYFDVPTPRYSGQRRIGRNLATGGSSRLEGAQNHVDWCASRYRSYRASDDTFQPFEGPRKPCLSPF